MITNTVAAITDSKFFVGGNATFTVANPHGEHFTFKIRQPKPEMPFFVSLMTGSDNESSFTYMGVYEKYSLVLTKKSKVSSDAKSFKVFNWAIAMVANHSQLPDGYTIQHDGKCCCCGRKLTHPESITLGIGPECIKRWQM